MIAHRMPSRQRFLARAARRVSQFLGACTARHNPALDRELQRLLDCDRQWTLLARLSHFDRAHAWKVYRHLVAAGERDPDLLRAALLHDVGKADERGRVMLGHRIIRVVLGGVAPGLMARLIDANRSWLSHGLYLAEHHARLGAELARAAGATERCCELILLHDAPGQHDDPQLAALVAADDWHAW